ncbi:unnamed protein product [Microthlaspi erraticum]|uniref:Arabidopsis retrotransposon Orf1 C-terminal domain-containing protein n=2 Tax=Microthlaspi erraticum TaxID=1685480 RepID=A0A6D2J8A8_9BRAS|nr:unnamed protein product [Microthlaspi erraticum]
MGRGESDDSSQEEGEEVNQLVDESEQESNQDEPMEEVEPQEEEEELPMYQEHYNALFSMDFVETRYPHVDTMKALEIFEDVELVLKNMHLGKFFSHHMESYKELTCEFLASMRYHMYDEEDRADFDQGLGWITFLAKEEKRMVTFRQLEIFLVSTMEKGLSGTSRKRSSKGFGLQSLKWGTLPHDLKPLKSGSQCLGMCTRHSLTPSMQGKQPAQSMKGNSSFLTWESNPSSLTQAMARGLEETGQPPHRPQGSEWEVPIQVHTSIGWPFQASPAQPRAHTVARGENIDFRPPVYTLVGHEDELREEEPELDRAEDRAEIRAEDQVQENESLVEPECYYFEEYEAPRMNPSVVAAPKRIRLLQRFNKWQGKAMDKMQKSMDNAQTAQSGWPRNERSTLGQNIVRPSEVSAKVQNRSAARKSRPGKLLPAVDHATTAYATAAHDRSARAGKQRHAAAQLVSRTTHERSVRPGELCHASGREISSAKFSSVQPQQPTTHPSGHDRSDRTRSGHDPIIQPIVPTKKTILEKIKWERNLSQDIQKSKGVSMFSNLAASDCNNCPDYDRSSRTTTSSPDSFQMTELKNMMAQVLKGQLKHINAIEGMSDANEDPSRECMGDFSNEANEEDVNYIGNYGNKGYNPSYRPNPNMSYRNPNVENPQDQVYPPRYPQQQRPPYQSQGSQFQPRQGYEQRSSYPPKEPYASSPNQAPPNQQGGRFEGILQQIMDGQKRNTKEMYEKMDTLFSNLNTKYDAVATHVKKLETQVTQTMEAVKRQEAESKKSFCNSAAIEERFEDQVPEWMLSKPTVDCMIWPEENYPERESNRARKRRLFPKIIPKTDNSGKLCLVSSKIGNCSIPTDFQIVEMRESSHRPLIFGTPFLSTVGAIFDFPNQRISFNKVNKGMFFPMCSTKNSFVDMVQEEKVTLKPPQEGETEETIKEDPIPKPKQLAKQARSKTKAPTPKPPKGSTKIEDEAKPRRRQCAKGHSWRDCLSSCESPTRYSLQGEKTWRIKDASCLHLLLSAKPYSQAKDLKQALHGRQPMRIEGEKGVKTQSAPNHWPRTRKSEFWPSNFQSGRPYGRAGKERLMLGRIHSIARQKPFARHARTGKKGRDRPDFRIGTDRPCRSIRETNSASAEISRPFEFGRPNRSTATKSIGHRPKLFSAKVSPLFIKFKPVLTNPKPT